MSSDSFSFSYLTSIAEVERQAWNRLADDSSPFLRHEFLLALEETGCTTRATGWEPHHLALYDSQQELVAVVPLYLKSNSWGEYVFDWSWADAYRSNGMSYYPKLLTAVPFTPSTGARFLIRKDLARATVIPQLVDEVCRHAEQQGNSSWHVLFPTIEEEECLVASGMQSREGCQFHWFNRDYSGFDDFLAALSSRKRKNIRKERQAVAQQGFGFAVVDGADISDRQWQRFYRFYQSTYHVRGMQGYLSQAFFQQLGRTMPENLMLIEASLDQQVVAAALFFRDRTRLFGRYWGSLDEYQFLHFETCFYQGIDYCIANGLRQFDAGAQGEHKIQRGFEPIRTVSAHWIAHPAFADAIADFLRQEQDYVRRYREQAASLLPFRKDQ